MVTREFWPIDGKDHSDVSEDGLYHNKNIENYLHSEQRTLIIAAKGMGKTLLLRAKKNILENASEGHIIIPRNQEFDYPEIRWTLPSKGMESYHFWKNLWLISFTFSALSHRDNLTSFSLKKYIDKFHISKEFKNSLLDDFEQSRTRAPSYYLCEMLQLGISNMNKLFYSCNDIDEMSVQFITSSTCIFIDAFDQTLTDQLGNDLVVWKNAQIGLIYAAHRIRNSNKHVKVFASIRYEAWSDFFSDDRQVIRGQALVLE
jgi:energy-coupling factor transporter ATP-binding protein EcfA2